MKTAKCIRKLRLEHALGCLKGLMCLNMSNCSVSHGTAGWVTFMAAVPVGVSPAFVQEGEEKDLS